MADIQSNIQVNIDTSEALASIKALQRQISAFHTSMAKSGAAASAVSANLQQNLINSLNATGKFAADMRTVKTTTESFTNALEKNKFTMREYFRYAGASTKTFGRLFRSEFDTIEKVARERVKTLQTQYIKMGRDANGAMKAIAVRPLALDMENLATKTQIAAQRQQLLNQLLKQGSTNLLNFGKNTQWAGRQLMVGFTIPLMYLGTAAAKTFMKLEEQAIRFKRVYGEMFTTGEETDKMLKEVQLLAKEFTKYGVAVEKTMEMAASAAASGKMGADLLAQVNEATRLAVLGGVEQEQALETTISLTNAFGIAAEDLTKKINFLNAVENQTVVSIEDLTVAIPKAGPVVKQLGGNVEDLAFFLTAMKEGGINASEGANALKSGLASLINPTDKASSMLAEMGINIKGIVEANKGNVKGIVIDFARALDTLDPLQRARAIEQLFGKFQFSRLSTLFQNVIAQGSQASRVLELTNATTEELAILSERELKRVEESPMYKFKKAIEDLKVTLAPVGEAFLKAVTPIVEFVSKILDKFNNLGDGAKNFVIILTTVLAGIGPVALMTFGLLANGLANIIKLFTGVKSLFNRVGQSSQTLGAQTQYMTQEQLEAAAVASSLNQVHNRLTQTFTSEANALSALISAYQRAIAAQAAFMPMRGFVGGKGGPKKFNKGTVGVRYYSRGTDTVPAMLTPGEAVIPAGPAQDPANKPFISHMVAGGVIGQHADGTVNVGGQGYNINTRQQATLIKIQSLIDGTIGQIDDILKIALQKLGADTKINLEQFKEQVRLAAASQGKIAGPAFAKSDWVGREKSYNARGAGERRTISQQLLADPKQGGRGAIAGQAELDQANAAAKAIAKKMEQMGATTKQITAATQLDRAHVIELNNAQKNLLAAWNSDVWVAQTGAENNLSNSLKSSKKNRELYLRYLSESGATEAQVQSITAKVTQGTALIGEELTIQGRVLAVMDKDIQTGVIKAQDISKNFKLYAGAVAEAATARVATMEAQGPKIVAATQRTEAELRRGIERIALAMPKAAEEALQVASPSRRMQKVGQESGRGLVLGATEFVDDAKITGKQLGTAIVEGVRTQSQMAVASRNALYGTGPIDPGQKSIRRQLQKQERLRAIQERRMLQQSTVAGMVAGGAGVRKSTPGDKNGDGIPDNTRGRMGAGTGMMAASGVMMAASMAPGKVGEVAQKLMMPLMTLTMLLPLIQSPLGAFAVGLTAVVAATLALRMAFDKAQDNAMKMAEAMGSGEKAIQDLSEFAGTARAGEIMDRRRAGMISQYQVQPGKTTFGQAYVKSEQGKAMLSNISETMKTGGKDAARSQLINQLTTGVASGALDVAQARSIAANISQQLGDYAFGIQVSAKLTELLGVNGENLVKDPLTLRVKLVEESRKNLQEKSKLLNTAAPGALTQTQSKFQMAGLGAVGAIAGGGLAAGALAGATAGSVVPVVGTAIGAAIGATIAAGVGYFAQKGQQEKLGRASGANVAMQKMALEQSQEMQDSLRLEYEQRIANAKAAGDTAQAIKLQGEYEAANAALLAENGKLVTDIQNTYANASGAVKGALETGVDKAITNKYKGTAMEDIAPMAKDLINDSGLSKEQQYTLKMQVASGNMDPMQIVNLMESFGKDKETLSKVMEIVTKFGGTFANQAMAISSLFVDKDGKPLKKQQTKFIADISTKTPAEAEKYLALFAQIGKVGQSEMVDMGVALTYYNNNPKAAEELDKTITQINEQKGKISLEVATTIVGAKEMEVLKANQEYFNSLPPEQQKVYLSTLTTVVNMEGNNKEAVQAWLKANPGKTELDYYGQATYQVTKASADTTTKPTGTTPGGTGKADSSPLDELLKKLRDVRKNQIKVTEGWEASRKALEGLFGGKKTITAFGGIEQDMRKIGAGQNLIEFITGMDPKEYEKRKNQLFKFDNKGNIVALKRDAQNIQEALNSIIAGDFQSGIEKQRQELVDQNTAFTKLSQLGVPVAKAYELIADKSFRAMIATAKNKKELESMINLYKKFIKEEASSTAIEDANKALEEATKEANFVEGIKSEFTYEQAAAIFADPILKALYMAGEKGSEQFKKRLEQQMSTIDFMQGIFDDGYNKAMEWFDVQEKAIQLDFELGTDVTGKNTVSKALQDLYKGTPVFTDANGNAILKFNLEVDAKNIAKYEDQVATLQYQIDDWEYSLKEIEDKEKDINESYDNKLKALESVEKLNARITQQQKSQLTIADALAQGDIAAAAKAVQDARAQSAQNAIDDQKKALDQARENALANVRNAQGFTRVQIEEKVKSLQDEIAKIEEEQLEPARERIRLAEVLKNEAVANLEVLGKTRTEWEQVKNGIDLARVTSKEYLAAMQAALDIVDKIKKYWADLNNKTYTTYHRIVTITDGSSNPGPGPGPGPGPECPDGFTKNANGDCVPKSAYDAPETPVVIPPSGYAAPTGTVKGSTDKSGTDSTTNDPSKDINYGLNTGGSTAALHLQDLERLANTVMVANVTKNAGQTAGQHLNDLINMSDRASAFSKEIIASNINKMGATAYGHLSELTNTPAQKAASAAAIAAEAKAAAAKKAAEEAARKKAAEDIAKFGGNAIAASQFANWGSHYSGGLIKRFAVGGPVIGTDVIPSMLTPGEFVMSRYAVESFGVDKMKAINSGTYESGSVYNYNLSVNVRSDANPEQIANTVMAKIRQIDSLRLRGSRL
jgi:TP901 family phage tail tape measure protein